MRANWTPGNMDLRGARPARDVRLHLSGGKVQGAVSAVLSAADAFREDRRSPPLHGAPSRRGSRRGGMRADGEGSLFEIEPPIRRPESRR